MNGDQITSRTWYLIASLGMYIGIGGILATLPPSIWKYIGLGGVMIAILGFGFLVIKRVFGGRNTEP